MSATQVPAQSSAEKVAQRLHRYLLSHDTMPALDLPAPPWLVPGERIFLHRRFYVWRYQPGVVSDTRPGGVMVGPPKVVAAWGVLNLAIGAAARRRARRAAAPDWRYDVRQPVEDVVLTNQRLMCSRRSGWEGVRLQHISDVELDFGSNTLILDARPEPVRLKGPYAAELAVALMYQRSGTAGLQHPALHSLVAPAPQ